MKHQEDQETSEREAFIAMRTDVRKSLLQEEKADNSIGRLADQVKLEVLRRFSAH